MKNNEALRLATPKLAKSCDDLIKYIKENGYQCDIFDKYRYQLFDELLSEMYGPEVHVFIENALTEAEG